MARSNQTQLLLFAGLGAAASISLLYYFFFFRTRSTSKGKITSELDDIEPSAGAKSSSTSGPTTPAKTESQSGTGDDKTPQVKNTKPGEKETHAKIEELDKRGKILFKEKQVCSILISLNILRGGALTTKLFSPDF